MGIGAGPSRGTCTGLFDNLTLPDTTVQYGETLLSSHLFRAGVGMLCVDSGFTHSGGASGVYRGCNRRL